MAIQTGKPLTEADDLYYRWGYDTLKGNLQLANEVLRQLLTLSAAFLGSGAYFLQKEVMSGRLIAVTLGLFSISLIVALFGVLPYSRVVDLNAPGKVREHKESALKLKRRYIAWSAAPLVLALIIAGLGVSIKQW